MAQMAQTDKDEKTIKKPTSSASRRTQDKWKKKKWFKIFSSPEFEKREIGETVAEKPKSLEGRVIRVNLGDLTGQRKKRHISIVFAVADIQGSNASTRVVGHNLIPSFMGRLVRRHNSKMEVTQYVDSKDMGKLKIKTVAISARKLAKSQETVIRKRINEFMAGEARRTPFGELVQEFAFGNTATKLYKEINVIAPIKRIEVTQSLSMSKGVSNDSAN